MSIHIIKHCILSFTNDCQNSHAPFNSLSGFVFTFGPSLLFNVYISKVLDFQILKLQAPMKRHLLSKCASYVENLVPLMLFAEHTF